MGAAGLGGLPERRLDQRTAADTHPGSGPAPQNQVFIGRLVLVGGGTPSGVFVYDPSVGAGKLIASMTDATTDPFGDATKKGITSYGTLGAFTELFGGDILIGDASSPVNAVISTSAGQLLVQGPGQAADAAGSVALNSRKASADTLAPELVSSQRIRVVGGGVLLTDTATPATPTGISILFSSAGTPQLLRPSSFTAALLSGLTDTTDRTVTQATTTQLGGNFTIPANDAAVGTAYRYTCGGTGTWGSTQQQLTLVDLLAGVNVNQFNIAATSFAASDPVDWETRTQVTIKTTGAGGTCNVRMVTEISKNNASSGTFVVGVRRSAGVAINTTIANVFQRNALWAATTGAPTITCNNSTFERIGP